MSRGGVRVHVNPCGFLDSNLGAIERAVLDTLEAESVREAEVSLTLVGDEAMRELNRGYLGKDRPTDVISFSLGGAEAPLGDVYVGVPQARRQAAELGIPLREELIRLAIHGTLHVLGWDHPEGEERARSPMFLRQEELVARALGRPAAPASR